MLIFSDLLPGVLRALLTESGAMLSLCFWLAVRVRGEVHGLRLTDAGMKSFQRRSDLRSQPQTSLWQGLRLEPEAKQDPGFQSC